MPEYLSPGVFIDEIPARLKTIEGVSTSTAGFVGESLGGTVPGWIPVRPPVTFGTSNGLTFTADAAPVLVTSFADYQSAFGAPPDDPSVDGYLGHAVRGFFENGGKRAYIARAPRPDALPAFHQVVQGAVLRLTRSARPNPSAPTEIFLNALTGLAAGGTFDVILPDGSPFGTHSGLAASAIDPIAGSISVVTGAITADLDPERVAIRVLDGPPKAGPRFWARNPGAWGNSLNILVSSSHGPAVPVLAASGSALQLQFPESFYIGAALRIDDGGTVVEETVMDIEPGGVLRVAAPLPALSPAALARVQEVEMTILDAQTGRFEKYPQLSWNSDPDPAVRGRHYSSVINSRSRLVFVEPTWAFTGAPASALGDETPPRAANQPMSSHGFAATPAAAAEGGSDGTPIVPIAPGTTRAHIIGVDNGPGRRTGIHLLQEVDDVPIIAAPGETDRAIQNELILQAERLRDRFAVLDGPPSSGPADAVDQILTHRNPYDTTFAAYYTPWVHISAGDETLALPPSGHVAGVYARTDIDRGVWNAPANEIVHGVIGLQFDFTTGEQDILNRGGVNAIRRFEGRGIRVWGARTLSSASEWRYVNVRRLLIFLEASLSRGTRWVVFEPNAPPTWGRVVESVSTFLDTQWRSGGLFGPRPQDAFFVRCDETTMTADDVQNGRLICEIGVAVVRPAEFVIFRIGQITEAAART
jgi:hypothetical protein